MEVTNGFAYRTPTDVDYARKNASPANPKEGPGGVNDEPRANPRAGDPVIQFGGSIQAPQANATADAEKDRARRDRDRAEARQEQRAARERERRVDIRA